MNSTDERQKYLEDQFQFVMSENQQLKKSLNSEKDKVKKLAAKLIKSMAGKSEHDIETEDSQSRIAQLEKENRMLKTRLQSAKAQLEAYTRLPLAPGFKSYLSSVRSLTPKNIWVAGPKPQHHVHMSPATTAPSEILHITPSPVAPPSSLAVSQPANSRMWDRNLTHHQVDMYEKELANLSQKLQEKQSTIDDLSLKITTLQSSEQRTEIHENIEVIKLQKQFKEKSSEVVQFQAKYQKAEQDLRILKGAHDGLLAEFDQLNNSLRREQNINTQIKSQLRSYEATHDNSNMRNNQEFESIMRENEILKDANEKLLANAFNSDRESEWMKTESSLRSKITQLENAIKADVNTRNELLERLASEIGRREQSEREMHQAETRQLQLKAELERLQRKIKTLNQDGIEWDQVEDALRSIKQSKGAASVDPTAAFLQHIPQEQKSFEEELQSLKVSFAETVQELEKTRNLLIAQNKINREYQAETELVARQAEYHKREYERQLQEYSKSLDDRAKRIHKLEAYIQDIAYGRKQAAIDIQLDDKEQPDQGGLESGQNLMEFSITKVDLKSDALRYMVSNAPSIFVTIDIFDFETQITPVVKGPKTDVSFTFQYYIVVSDLFVYYLNKESATVELHQTVGSSYKTWAAGSLKLKDLLSAEPGRIFFGVPLTGVALEAVGVNFGTVEINIALKLPIARALAMYKERAKAIGLVDVGDVGVAEPEQTNTLIVSIHRMRGLTCKYNNEAGPSSYVMYRVFDFPDHDTAIVNSNANPQLNDSHAWSLPIGRELEIYLKTQNLNILVFDDSAPSDDLSYIGYASIPLLPLAHNKPIAGTFPVLQDHDTATKATVDVSLNWKFTYISVPDQLFVTKPAIDLGPEKQLPEEGEDRTRNREPIAVKTAQPKAKDDQKQEETQLTKLNLGPGAKHKKIPAEPIVRQQAAPFEADEQKQQESPPTQATESSKVIESDIVAPRTEKDPKLGSVKEAAGATAASVNGSPAAGSSPSHRSSSPPTPQPRPRKGSYTVSTASSSATVQKMEVAKVEEQSQRPAPPPRQRKQAAQQATTTVDVMQALKQEIDDHSQSTTHDEDIVLGGNDKVQEDTPTDTEIAVEVVIGVHSLWLPERSPLLVQDETKKPVKVFVEWKTDDEKSFLGLAPEKCETSDSLLLPTNPDEKINFDHFSKIAMDKDKLQALQEIQRKDRTLHFVLVSDPDDDGEEGECDELGFAEVKLRSLTTAGDMNREDVDVVNSEGKRIAKLKVTVQAKDALQYAVDNK